MVKTWTTDVRDLLPRDEAMLALSARSRDDFTRGLIEAATSRRAGEAWLSAVRCIARSGRKMCATWISVARVQANTIPWSCARCGQKGEITGFEHSEHDLSGYIPKGKTRLWGVDEESRNVLWAATVYCPSLRAVVARASPVEELEGFLRIDATVDELDEVYTLVEQLTDLTRSRRRIELLDDLRHSLSVAMDGF